MKKLALVCAAALLAGVQSAHAALVTYNVTTTWYEPETQPNDSIFQGTFVYDTATHAVSNLQGQLSESMTGTDPSNMVWLTLSNQLVSWYDATLGGTFAATFKNTNTNTFWTGLGGDGWSPSAAIAVGGVYYGFPVAANNPGNAYALIFVPDDPTAALSTAQLSKLAYADCVPTAAGGMMMGGGMMGSVCMTGTSLAGYGEVGTMGGYPVSQSIAPAVPVPAAAWLFGSGVLGLAGIARRKKSA